jgi:hypothetical protein
VAEADQFKLVRPLTCSPGLTRGESATARVHIIMAMLTHMLHTRAQAAGRQEG